MTTTTKTPLYRKISTAIVARKNCIESNNAEWHSKWMDMLEDIERNYLPSGSGIDSGCKLDLDESNSKRIVIDTAFHHMNDGGYYDGWTEHKITVTPSFNGIDIRIGGRDRNQIKDYLHDVFYSCLTADFAD